MRIDFICSLQLASGIEHEILSRDQMSLQTNIITLEVYGDQSHHVEYKE